MTVIICGAGAAGLMAAGTAAKTADKVVLVEKNDAVGRKLRITGKGRCNITNACEIEDMIGMFPVNGRFLYSALYTFTNDDIISLLEDYGVKTKIERGNRVFPVSDDARDVVAAMRKYALQKNVKLVKAEVKSLIIDNGEIKGIKTSSGKIMGDKVILCCGGASYPVTGSDGSGYKLAKMAGHTIIKPVPSLVPLVTAEKWCRDIMGLSLKNVEVTAYNGKGKKVHSGFGEMLFTHFGVSGPIILSLSAHIKNVKDSGCMIKIDLKPALDEAQLDARVLRDFEKQKNKHIINSLDALLPKALIPVVVRLAEIEPHKSVNEITRSERKRLCSIIKGLTLHITGFRPISEAIVTSGGVKTSEIDPSTMESKKIKGLYFAGEIIDVDGYTGGFNLQCAWSTGYLAGSSAAV
ncbi:MAG: NAD(P)/FAD-dependent oxidoreductase [Oscillospiraceae bacterium]|nr:NAD(P)/FAD-dependent oxidoreductase [Oscillospiraceae bacterium]